MYNIISNVLSNTSVNNPLYKSTIDLDDAIELDMSDVAEFTLFETHVLNSGVDKHSIRVTVWLSPERHYNFCYIETEEDCDTTIESAQHPLDLVQFLPDSAQRVAANHILAWLDMLVDAAPVPIT